MNDDDAADAYEGVDPDDAPSASGEFASMLKEELRARGLRPEDGSLAPSSPPSSSAEEEGEDPGATNPGDDPSRVPRFGFLGPLGRDRAFGADPSSGGGGGGGSRPFASSPSPLSPGAPASVALAFALACAAWHAPALVAALAPRVPILAALLDAFASLRALGVGFDAGVAAACTTATFKIVVLCVAVGRLMRGGALPRETPVVLSKLAFNVLLPAYMCTRVALTLDATPLTLGLATLPLSAVAQVVVGGAVGAAFTAAANLVPQLADATNWRPSRAPGRDAEAVAESVAKSIGLRPGAKILPAGPPDEKGGGDGGSAAEGPSAAAREAAARAAADPMARVGVACCAFGNTFTLPLVFLVEVLGAVHGDKVAGFIALYLIGWSPALWTIGYSLLAGGGGEASSSSGAAARGGGPGRSAHSSRGEGGFLAALKVAARETVNPPLVGICLGVLIGVTPLRRYLLGGSDAFLSPSLLPPELALVQGAAKALFELAVLIGGAALPGQTLVLASSFVKFDDDAVDGDRAGEGEGGSEDGDARGGKKKNASEKTPDSPTSLALARRATMIRVTITAGARDAARSAFDAARGLFSLGASDFRALFVASLVRFFVLPLGGVLGALALRAANSPWYPEDPIVAVVVLTMAAMPPAQNLVLLTNLREETRHLAPRLAGLLLRMYVLAIPPTTAWLTVFTAAVA